MSYSSGNPNFDMHVKVETALRDAYLKLDPFRFVTKVPVGAGEKFYRAMFATMPSVPKATVDSVVGELDKFSSLPGMYRVPRHRKTITLSEDEYRAIMSGGNYQGYVENVAKALSVAVAKTFFLNNTNIPAGSTSDFPYYGIVDPSTGVGTNSRPVLCGPSTKVTGAWTTATIGANSAAALKARITKYPSFNDGTPLVAVYPNVIEEVMEAQNPGILSPSRIRDEFLSRFGAVVPAGETDEMGTTYAKSVLSGNEETPTDFDLVSYNPKWFIGIFEQSPTAKLDRVVPENGAILTLIHNIGLMPIPMKSPDGYTRKAAMLLAASGT